MESNQAPLGTRSELWRNMGRYRTEEQCREQLRKLIWPKGFCCRRCRHDKAWHVASRDLYVCANCKTQHSLTAGTPLHARKCYLPAFFVVLYFYCAECGFLDRAPYRDWDTMPKRWNLTRGQIARILEITDGLPVGERQIRRWLNSLSCQENIYYDRFIYAFVADLKHG